MRKYHEYVRLATTAPEAIDNSVLLYHLGDHRSGLNFTECSVSVILRVGWDSVIPAEAGIQVSPEASA
jgi:hypothetical protein